MVARVCNDDPGYKDSGYYDEVFMTFSKVRLLCPYESGASETLLYFDVLKSIVRVDDDIIYGLFHQQDAWGVQATAVCTFSLKDIDDNFNGARFPHKITVDYYGNSARFS